MIPGPQYVYKCPSCSHLLQRGSLAGGNTFGAHLYSGGKQTVPMLPDFPEISRYRKCNSVFWLFKLEVIGTCYPGYQDHPGHPEWEAADNAWFPGTGDCFMAFSFSESNYNFIN